MAIGDVTTIVQGSRAKVEALASETATNSAPSGASAGLETNALGVFGKIPTTCIAEVVSTAGSATMTVTIRVWGYDGANWTPLGNSATGTSQGILNDGNAITESSADKIAFSQPISYLGAYSRVYFEITAIGGTSTAVTVFLIVQRDL